tara:strand:- start:278 stop:451 length:174 start_codon:yes stop_codon:yes gene_type:complete
MNSITKQIKNVESTLYDVEVAMDVAVTSKEQNELGRKRSKLQKKINKLKRKLTNKEA